MIQGLINKVFGTPHERARKKIWPKVQRVTEFEPRIQKLSDAELQAKTGEFRQRIENGESLDSISFEAFAVCREAAKRVMKMRHYDVQILGGYVLHQGAIAEMRTGEGKTLTATLPIYLNGLTGKGAHLVTVNEYLAERDAEWMGQLYRWLGLTVGVTKSARQMNAAQKREAYLCDVTYGTNNEFGFDYLRDNMKFTPRDRSQRELNFAIVDEVDSILIDEARTPLIISGPAESNADEYIRVNKVVAELKRDEHYVVDEEHRSSMLTDEGIERVQERLGIENLFDPNNINQLQTIQKSLDAHTLYKKDERYMIVDNEVVIVDEFTGRAMPGRRWSDGLHQAVEAKEGVPIKAESVTYATITYQNFFRMYDKLSGMTGTADTEAEEFVSTYDIKVTVIPTNKPVIRKDQPDLIYKTEREKFAAIVDQIVECNKKGQPVLVGTVSVDKSEVISKVLKKKKIKHSVLNAKLHGKEAEVVAQAGRKGAVTIATNMAGRGTDILLGGNPEVLAAKINPDEESEEYAKALERFKEVCKKEKQEVLDSGGLFILGTERHDSRRIDNQLRGRAGRQGDPGESRFFLSLEDELMRRFGADRIQGLMERLGMEDGVPIESGLVSKNIENAQRRVEGRNFDIRKHLLDYDDVMDVQRKAIYELRNKILEGDGIDELILDALDESLAILLDQYANAAVRIEEWDFDSLARELKETFALEVDTSELPTARGRLEEQLWTQIQAKHDAKIQELEKTATSYNERYKDREDFEEKTAQIIFEEFAQNTYLKEVDRLWRDHLRAMRGLRDSVGLHGYAQRDPKYIFKKEGFDLFEEMRATINANVSKALMRMVVKSEESVQKAEQEARARKLNVGPGGDGRRPSLAAAAAALQAAKAAKAAPKARPAIPKLGRNDKCWCGSGKKYKHCHMKADRENAAGGGAPAAANTAPAKAEPPVERSEEEKNAAARADGVKAPPPTATESNKPPGKRDSSPTHHGEAKKKGVSIV